VSLTRFVSDRILLFALVCIVAFIIIPTNEASAQLADGKYSVKYVVTQPDSNSASMANDYFLKPATLIVENGAMKARITMKNSSWLTKFDAQSGGNSVIGKDSAANTRTVQFNVKDLANPILANIRVDIEDMDYHHDYTIRFVFDASSATLVSGGESNTSKETATKSESDVSKKETSQAKSTDASSSGTVASSAEAVSAEQNPKTSDTTTVSIFVVALLASAFLLIRRLKSQR